MEWEGSGKDGCFLFFKSRLEREQTVKLEAKSVLRKKSNKWCSSTLLQSEWCWIQTRFDLTHQWNLELRQLKLHEKSASGERAGRLCAGTEVWDSTDWILLVLPVSCWVAWESNSGDALTSLHFRHPQLEMGSCLCNSQPLRKEGIWNCLWSSPSLHSLAVLR